MLSSLIKDNLLDDQENREKIQKDLNKIYELLTNKKSKKDEALNLLDDLLYEKIYLEEIPQSLNLQGCLIMTFSKFWMIIILISLNQMKFRNDKIKKLIELVNISFYQDLNERNEYKSFFEDLCEELISDKIAFDAINLNNHLKKKLKNKNDHLEIKKHYIYLLNKPYCFQNEFNSENRFDEKNKNEDEDENNKNETINTIKAISKKMTKKKKDNINNKAKENNNSSEEEIESKKTNIESVNDEIEFNKSKTNKYSKKTNEENKSGSLEKRNKIKKKKPKKIYRFTGSGISLVNKKNLNVSEDSKLNLSKISINKNKKKKNEKKRRSLTQPKNKKKNQKSKGIKTLKKNNKKESKKSSKKTNDGDESLDISNIRKSLKDKKLSLSNELDDSFLKELYEDNVKKSTTKNKKKNKGKKKLNIEDEYGEYDDNDDFNYDVSNSIDYGKYIDIDSDQMKKLLNHSFSDDFNSSKEI